MATFDELGERLQLSSRIPEPNTRAGSAAADGSAGLVVAEDLHPWLPLERHITLPT